MTYRTAALGCGAFCTIAGFICLLVALCTNAWVVIQVDRSSLTLGASSTQTLAAFTRYRGIFKECFDDREATKEFVKNSDFGEEPYQCLRNDFVIDRRVNVAYSGSYKTRADLMIAMVVMFCFALLLCLCGLGVFCYSVSMADDYMSKKWSLTTKWSGILIFMAAFCTALGMALFHGAELMELENIETNGAEVPYQFYFKMTQSTALQNATTRTYSWSYALGWLAVFFEVVAAICLFLCGACGRPSRGSEKEFFEVNTMNSSRSYGQRNLAYEYMEGNAPAIYEGQPPPQMITDGAGYHEHFRGRHFDPYNKGPIQQPAHTQYNYEDGGWNWQ